MAQQRHSTEIEVTLNDATVQQAITKMTRGFDNATKAVTRTFTTASQQAQQASQQAQQATQRTRDSRGSLARARQIAEGFTPEATLMRRGAGMLGRGMASTFGTLAPAMLTGDTSDRKSVV